MENNTPICCLCGRPCENEYGNNPEPLSTKPDKCCDKCNLEKVIPARIILEQMKAKKELADQN